ncbi:hypothetical protein HanXRQr2_Chr11g0499711 [Helianthus annuus]|uniref:Uncharacterized protein n=1 Tax=Helianthus annuus TaxID=4232 RepID=A0A9K3HQT5_HELAN|nr:hypothetical protein HanXRQr2_Chr11g0499711 [Helianthus annuus]KAJ0875851.1 hypothetical protein HanPSC8_Chr11g0481431 [Helianthus annuus]
MLYFSNPISEYLSKMSLAAFQSHFIDASYKGTPILRFYYVMIVDCLLHLG